MKSTWQGAIGLILASEGPELSVNPPGTPRGQGEPGGASKYGVSVDALTDWHRRTGLPAATVSDVSRMTQELASDIYWGNYAVPIRYEELPAGVDYRLADISINLGVTGGAWLLQVTLGVWPLSNQITDDVLKEVLRQDPRVLTYALGAAWLSKKHEQPGWVKSGHGWTNRAVRVTQDALKMIGS